jgi:hypothetical protein
MKLTTRTALLCSALIASPSVFADAQVRVGHFAPFADTLDATSVNIAVNGDIAISGLDFGETTDGYINLPAGDYTLDVLPVGSEDVAITADVTLEDDTAYTVLALGNVTDQPLTLLPLVDDTSAPADGEFKLRLVHGVPAAAAASVDVRTALGDPVLTDFAYATASDVLNLAEGNYDLKITTPGGGTDLIDLTALDLPAGANLTVVAIGDVANQPLGAFALELGALETRAIGPVFVNVAHLAPFAGDSEVSISVNGEVAIPSFTYPSTSGYVELGGQGVYDVAVTPAGADAPALEQSFDLGAGRYTVAAIGDGGNQPLALFPLVDNPGDLGEAEVAVRVAHTAPFASELDATSVSVRTAGGDVVGGLSSVPFGVASGFLTLPASTYDLKIASPDGETNFLDPEPVELPGGTVVTLFAIGNLGDADLEILAVFEDGSSVLLPLRENVVDFAATGAWYNPELDGQGLQLFAYPAENRLWGAWFTYAADGSGQPNWFRIDSFAGGYSNNTAELDVFAFTGGTFNVGGGVSSEAAGTATITFTDCNTATLNFEVEGISDELELVRLGQPVTCAQFD